MTTSSTGNKDYEDIPLEKLLEKQSVALEGSPDIRCSPMLIKEKLVTHCDDNARTLHEFFLRGLKESGNGPCLGWRPGPDEPYEWITYQEVLDRAQRFGSGLIAEGAQPDPSQNIGIFSQNRVEWKVVEQACNSFSMVVVTLYDTLGPEAIRHIVNQCELKFIVMDVNAKAKTLMEECKKGNLQLGTLIIMEAPSDEVKDLAKETGTSLKTYDEIMEIGKEKLKDFVPPKSEDLHTICYTSGTTGMPKGVMLTHANLVANHAGVYVMGLNKMIFFNKNDVYISYLPLAHVFERLMASAMYFVGARVGFFRGDIKSLLPDVAALRPTVFPMVPRLINRIYDKIWTQASQSKIKHFFLEKASAAKMASLQRGKLEKHALWDALVYRKIRARFGGRVNFCVTGAAPVSLEVISFMRGALGIPFTEGYGQTESTAALSVSVPGDYTSGSVGSPILCNYIKLVDVPEKNYFAKDGKGEICAKGPNIFMGYYKDPEKTKETLDEDGWLHTGDVGMWLPNGALKIIDRKKHIFKLSQGEYIAPEKIEGILSQSLAVAQVFVHGESLKSSIVAIVIPDNENLVAWASDKGVHGSFDELVNDGKVNKLILDDMLAIGSKRGLKSFELPKQIFLSAELFSVENNLLTPTFKTRRPQVYEKFKTEIDQMYKSLD